MRTKDERKWGRGKTQQETFTQGKLIFDSSTSVYE